MPSEIETRDQLSIGGTALPTPSEHTLLDLEKAENEKRKSPNGVQEDDLEVNDSAKGEGEAEDDYPDGGLRAWLIVVGAMCTAFATFGYVNSWGIFQGYYQRKILPTTPPSDIAWIGSIQYAFVFMPNLVVGRLFDLGYFRIIFTASTALLVASTFLVPQCTEYWHFLLCQGFAVGIACGGTFGPTTAVIAHWWKKRLGLAMGLCAVGSATGGTILPIIAKNLLPRVGFHWTMRIFGFILLTVLTAANLLLKRRLPPKNVAGGLFDWKTFKSAPFSMYCLSAFTAYLGLYTILTFVDVSATEIGISDDFSFYFVAFGNASSLIGRYVSGMVSDTVGPMNVMIPLTACAGVLTYAWPYAQTQKTLIAVTVLYGFASGSYISLVTNPVVEFGGAGDVGRRVGMFMSVLSLGAIAGPPISGAIHTAMGGFEAVGFYAGSAVLVSVVLMAIVRYLVLKRFWGKI